MSRADAVIRAVVATLKARRESLEDRGLCSVLIEAKVNPQTGVVRAALIGRRKIPVASGGNAVKFH